MPHDLRRVSGIAPRRLAAALALVALLPHAAHAQLTVTGGLESFHWLEDTRPRKVEERGPVAALDVGWTRPLSGPFRVGYRSRYYLGWIDYHGSYLFAEEQAATGTSRYVGTEQGGLLMARVAPTVDLYGGIAGDWWGRSLGANEREDFTVGFTRLGVRAAAPGHENLWADAGAKFVFTVIEDAHLRNLGFDQDPMLRPQGHPSGFARVGWRVRDAWSVEGFVEGYRFGASPSVQVTHRRQPPSVVHQPASDLRILGLKLGYAF